MGASLTCSSVGRGFKVQNQGTLYVGLHRSGVFFAMHIQFISSLSNCVHYAQTALTRLGGRTSASHVSRKATGEEGAE